MPDATLFPTQLTRTEPAILACGQLPLALAGALCGPASMRSVRPVRSSIVLRFEHATVGRVELAFAAGDEQAHRAVRDIRADPTAFARLFAVLACALELDGQPGGFTYEAVHRLTHGPRTPGADRSRLNAPLQQHLHVMTGADVSPRSLPSPTRRSESARRQPTAGGFDMRADLVAFV